MILPLKALSQEIDSTGYLSLYSNYESFYLIMDNDSSRIIDYKRGDIIPVELGDQYITIVPEYSQQFTFRRTFKVDSLISGLALFGDINSERNRIFERIKDEEMDYYDEKPKRIRYIGKNGSFITKTFFKDADRSTLFDPITLKLNSYIKFNSNSDSLYVEIKSVYLESKKIAKTDSIAVPAGNIHITISSKNSKEYSTSIFIQEGTTGLIEHQFENLKPNQELLTDNLSTKSTYNASLIIITDEDSEILINDVSLGKGIGFANPKTGPNNIRILNDESGNEEFEFKEYNFPHSKSKIIEAYSRPSIKSIRIYSVLPGVSQFLKKENKKSGYIASSFILFGGLSMISKYNFDKKNDEFDDLLSRYNRLVNEIEVTALGDQLSELQNELQQIEKRRNAFYTVTALIFTYNIIDAWFKKPKGGYKKKTDLSLYLDQYQFGNISKPGVGFKYEF